MSIPAIPKDYYGHKTELFLDNLCNQESDNLRDHKHIGKGATEINTEEYPIISYQAVKNIMKKRIGYDALINDRPYEKNAIDEILEIIVEVMTCTKETIRVNQEEKPAQIVKSIYWKLDMECVLYVLESLIGSGQKAHNIRAVMITALYNAPMTVNTYHGNLYAYHQANLAGSKA